MRINHSHLVLLAGLLSAGTLRVQAQVPQVINYQGRISISGTNPAGPALDFKFALVNPSGTTTHWSHDNSSVNGSEPTGHVALAVAEGLFSVALGDTSIPGMTKSVASTVFDHNDVHLRIWVRDTNAGPAFQLLSPDQRIGSVGYAMMSASVINGVITQNKLDNDAVTEPKIADGAVTTAKLASNAVTNVKIADNAVSAAELVDSAVTSQKLASNAVTTPKLINGAVTVPKLGADVLALMATSSNTNASFGSCSNCTDVDIYGTSGCHPAITLDGCSSLVSLFMQSNAVEAARFQATPGVGGSVFLRDPQGQTRLSGRATSAGGSLSVFAGTGFGAAATLSAANNYGGAYLQLSRPFSTLGDTDRPFISLSAQNSNGTPQINLGIPSGEGGLFPQPNTTVQILAAEAASQGSAMKLFRANGNQTIEIDAEGGNGTGGKGGFIALFDGTNTADAVITLDANGPGGCSRIKAQVVEITGGCDLSENFDIKPSSESVEPGMIVCIDPENPGHLVASTKAYDSTVAGVVSGAGGVRPGMLMGQNGNSINGKYPVALTGRVYCLVDADQGSVRPGDLVTTSDTPGHGMKATDLARAQGSIIGKAMTKLEAGKGLVLVLVSLQ